MSIQDIPTPQLRFGNARPARVLTWPDLSAMLRRPTGRHLVIDVTAIAVAILDVWLTVPSVPVGWESHWFSWLACAALLARRRFPLLTDRKSTRLNSSHVKISYAVFCLKKKT